MPITPTYPGVYIEEIPSGVRTITGVATSIAAFVGYTAQGPVDKAVRIANFGDFKRTFGGLSVDGEIGYAVQQFFLNGGTDAYVVRVAQGAAEAQVTIKDTRNHDALCVTAASPGVWGNTLRLDVDYATTNPDSTFNLGVKRYELKGAKYVVAATEKYLNLSMNSHTANYARGVVNNASQLVRLALPSGGLTLDDATNRGWSLSGDLSTFPTLTSQTVNISGILDDGKTFSLVLAGTPPSDLDQLVTALGSAIAVAGLSARLKATRADALGADNAGGNFLKLQSVYVGADPNTKAEFSRVQIETSTAKDAARILKLGLSNGGREKEGASVCRPAETGTASADLADLIATSAGGALDVTVRDNSASPAGTIYTGTLTIPAATKVGTAMRDALQTALIGTDVPALRQTVVQLNGTALRVLTSADTATVSITFGNTLATTLRLTGAGSFVNVQQFALGTGADFGAQSSASAGADGTAPGADKIIGDYDAKKGLYALRDVDLFNLLVIPRTAQMASAQANAVYATALAFCEERRAFYLLDPDPTRTAANIGDWLSAAGAVSRNGAVFFPQVQIPDPLNNLRLTNIPPSGTMAGVFARTDAERGVWKAPAGIDASLRGVQGLSVNLTDAENGTLNPLGINCLRVFPVYGIVSWGARTLRGADQAADEYKYTPVRRMALFIEESLYRGTKWVVFEPNDEPLWAQIRLNIGAFMHTLFRQGAFQGKSPKEAYFVKCDAETTTQNDINLGIVNILVGFAPLKPAEFVIIQLQQMAGQIQV